MAATTETASAQTGAPVQVQETNGLFAGVPKETVVWMSHGDQVQSINGEFVPLAATETCPVAAVLNPEVLCHRDLDRLHVVPVPDRLEHRVREPQVEDLLEPHLPEVVVDPVELRLVDVLVQLVGELRCGSAVVAEGLLYDDPCVLG